MDAVTEAIRRKRGRVMPYEDDYKMWLEQALIEMNPDWICDGMSDNEFTDNWCHQHCGEDSAYITPKCLHMYYHHIARADRKTEPSFKVDGIGDDDPTIHAIAHLQKVGWLQEHDRALTEPNSSEKPNNCEDCKWGEDKHRYACICNECGVGIDNYEPKDEPQTERSE